MLSFLRCVLCCDDELNTGVDDESSFLSDKYHIIPNNYDTLSRTNLIPSTQTATRNQSQNYPTCFNFPQISNTPSVFNQRKQTLPKINSEVHPIKVPYATYPIFPKSTSSSSLKLVSSASSPCGAFPSSPISRSVSKKRILARSLSTQTLIQTTTQCNVVEKGSTPPLSVIPEDKFRKDIVPEKGWTTPLSVIPEDKKGLFRKDIVPGVLKKPLSPQTYGDYSATLLNAEDYHLEVPARRSLADYLTESGPRLVSLYGSTELYPTDEARCIIQGMVTAVLSLKKDKRKHNYLKNPENLVLDYKECHPYSNYVRATEQVLRNRKILEQAGKDFPTTIQVTLEKNRMHLKSDDLEALKYLIFNVILVLDDDKKPPLPAEWKSFKKLFSNTELDYAVMSSHPCLWGYTKRLGFYFALDNWSNPFKSEKEVRDIVDDNLSSMQIFGTNWVKRIKKDSHLRKFTGKMTRSRQRKVYGLIRFFRNLVEHCRDMASASSPYKKESYLDYKLRTIYPNLLEELHQRLLLAGFDY